MTSPSEATFLFDTTHMALWAEETALGAGIPVEVVPAPPDTHARCDLALVSRPGDVERLSRVLEETGVEFYPPA